MARKFRVFFCGAIALLLLAGQIQAAPFLPNFDLAIFQPSAAIDNTYFPLTDNKQRVFQGEVESDGVVTNERFEFTTLGIGPTILGVQTTTRRDRAFIDNVLVEETFDFYAQDTVGNVWYFGEDVTNYRYDDAGNLIGTDSASAWRAGVNGALPGFIMPADLTLSFNYFQESAPADEALDEGTTFSIEKFISIGFGDYSNVLKVLETSTLNSRSARVQILRAGAGTDFGGRRLSADLTNPAGRLELVSEVPLPATLTLMVIGLAGLLRSRPREIYLGFPR